MAEPVTVYNSGFYETLREGSRQSARHMVPEILRLMEVKSVVDVGCGVGTWLRAFQDCGVKDCLGIDGDYVDIATLEVEPRLFKPHDLQTPLRLDRRFDLVVSLEVAEHIPPEKAALFVETLTGLGPVLMFSAAIPFQNGNNHLNEQWPDFWAERFAVHGYVPVDCIRRKFWNDPQVEPWYAQNTLVYVKEDLLSNYPLLAHARQETGNTGLSIVHPKLYFKARYEAQVGGARSVGLENIPLRRIFAALPARVLRAVRDNMRGTPLRQPNVQIAHYSQVPLSETRTTVFPAADAANPNGH